MEQRLPGSNAWSDWLAYSFVLAGFLLGLTLVAVDQFVLWPMSVGRLDVVYVGMSEGDQAAIARSMAVWLGLSAVVMILFMLIIRGAARRNSGATLPVARALCCAAAMYASVILLSAIPNTALGVALFKLADLARVHRDATLPTFNVVSGIVAVSVALTCLTVLIRSLGIRRRSRRRRPAMMRIKEAER